MKNILVPTDFSNNAYAGLFYVSKLFAEETTRITILHSFEDELSKLTSRVDVGRSEAVIKSLFEHSDEDGNKLLKKIKHDTDNEDHTYEVISTPASLTRTINKLVSTEGMDLVVVGSKGRTAAADVLMGSNTTKIIQNLKGCPLLVVPQQVEFVIPLNIAFSTDFLEFYQLSKLKPITRLVRHFRSQIHIVHVGREEEMTVLQKQNLEHFRNDLSEYDTEFHFVPKMGNVSKTLHEFIDAKSIDLLSLVYHKHAFIKALFREPVVSNVGRHTHVPTLVIPISI
ncbi:universal stress protein [Aequorivita sp. H23M31]|uniref:Universal stress protein n=1 Tax=Aequorivita ciconiae TaxID=2494375 RepID=A0A410FZV5_9FLAO|nr:universal stress protein [Aequorivita sp. H23M31]QAA80521.1 universal stress protein [Aequorivita sp. H23M31]